jgi:RNA polymerase sigma-70 factor (ECF subfamily)
MELTNEQAQEYLGRIAQRDEKALRELHRLLGRRIYAFALNRLHDPDESEAIVSDTLYEIWKHPTRFRGESRFSTWVLGIARYKILTNLRSRTPEYEELDDQMPADDLGSFDILAGKERREGILHCMERLSEVHRECLHLVFYEELSLAEIAQIQNCPENTVKTRLFHARLKIKNCLERFLKRESP